MTFHEWTERYPYVSAVILFLTVMILWQAIFHPIQITPEVFHTETQTTVPPLPRYVMVPVVDPVTHTIIVVRMNQLNGEVKFFHEPTR